MSLTAMKCKPCSAGVDALRGGALAALQAQLKGWQVVGEHHLQKMFAFPDFRSALDFVNRVGELAESEGHHPDLYLAWGRVDVKLWTHKIDGIAEADFILAAKIDRVFEN